MISEEMKIYFFFPIDFTVCFWKGLSVIRLIKASCVVYGLEGILIKFFDDTGIDCCLSGLLKFCWGNIQLDWC